MSCTNSNQEQSPRRSLSSGYLRAVKLHVLHPAQARGTRDKATGMGMGVAISKSWIHASGTSPWCPLTPSGHAHVACCLFLSTGSCHVRIQILSTICCFP